MYTYNAATPSSYLTTNPNTYQWQRPNNNVNKQSSHATPLPALPSLPSTPSELPGQKNSNLSLSDQLAYVEALVDMNAMVIEAIWPTSATGSQSVGSSIVPLRCFIQEVLKRSRTTYSTLQTAFFYLFRARPAIVHYLHTSSATRHSDDGHQGTAPLNGRDAYIHCGRRMFLASLVVASKFVQDKTYRNSVWAKIAGLTVQEINASERVFLGLLDYRLYVAQPTFDQWHQLLHSHVQAKTSSQKYGISSGSYTDSNNSNRSSNKSLSQSPSPELPAYITKPTSSSPQKSSYPISTATATTSSLPSPMNPTNDTSLPPIRPSLCILPSSSTTTSSSTIPALSPSSIASTSSSTCSPILNNNLSLNIATAGGKRRLLNEHDITPYLHHRSASLQQRKRPCNTWPSSSSSNFC
ncbi:unnamed protein product [Absidia cylindrospora]